MPGGPGQLPAQGSHGSVRARIRAYGSSNHGFAALAYNASARRTPVAGLRSSSAIRCCCVDTVSNVNAFAVFPHNGSMIRCTRFPPHGPIGSRSRASSVLSRHYESCRPSCRTSFPSFGSTTIASCILLRSAQDTKLAARVLRFGNPLHRNCRGDDRCSQVPGEPQLSRRHVLRPRQDDVPLTEAEQSRWPPLNERRRLPH